MVVEWVALYPFDFLLSFACVYFSAATSSTRVRIIKRELGIETLSRVVFLLYAYREP